jgi:hypothetical protein
MKCRPIVADAVPLILKSRRIASAQIALFHCQLPPRYFACSIQVKDLGSLHAVV